MTTMLASGTVSYLKAHDQLRRWSDNREAMDKRLTVTEKLDIPCKGGTTSSNPAEFFLKEDTH